MTTRNTNAVAAAWQAAARLIEAGRAAEAETSLRQAIQRFGADPDLLHLQGVALLRLGRPMEAVPVLKAAIARQPGQAGFLLNLGNALLDAGQPAEARSPLSEAARLAPQVWQAAYLLGIAAERLGDQIAAADAFGKVVAADPSVWDAHLRLVTAFRLAGKSAEAIQAARVALRVRPDELPIRHDLAMLLALAGDPKTALAEVDDTLRRAPDFAQALNTRGNILGDLGRKADSIASYGKALAIAPDLADAHYNLANMERAVEAYDVASRRYRRALAIAPTHANARLNLAASMLGAGQVDDCIATFDACLQVAPGWHDALFNLGLARLLKGDMKGGLDGYESRWHVSRFPGVHRNLSQPMWNGESFAGRTLLLHAEQGAGDTIQFARYVPLIAARGGNVLLEVPGSLVRLMQTLGGGARLVRPGEMLPPFDLQLPLGSAMRAFGTEIATIPATVPYLSADANDRARWRARFAGGEGLKIGITWQGNPDQGAEPYRSIPLALLKPVLDLPGCRFFALQKEYGREQMAALPPGTIEDVGPELTDFAETAAAIAELDLVITTCTSVAHLAGALGKRTLILLRFAPDWRWLLGRSDSPWYPTAELFRQPSPGDWGSAVATLLARLKATLHL